MSYLSHDALRQYACITDVSPVGTIRDCRIPNTLPSCGPRREPPVRAVFFRAAGVWTMAAQLHCQRRTRGVGRRRLEQATGGH
jgi:hypothetical protein